MIFGVLGKLSAIFVSIPHPVLGGALVMMAGMFIGVNLSNLKPVDLSSSRNLAIIGVSVMVGLVVPMWIKEHPDDIDTGELRLSNCYDQILVSYARVMLMVCLGVPMCIKA